VVTEPAVAATATAAVAGGVGDRRRGGVISGLLVALEVLFGL
jgi:hypothetical protein